MFKLNFESDKFLSNIVPKFFYSSNFYNKKTSDSVFSSIGKLFRGREYVVVRNLCAFYVQLPIARFPLLLKCQSSLGEHAYDEPLP